MWAFGGTLEYKDREAFSSWWKAEFDQFIDFPEELCVGCKYNCKQDVCILLCDT